MINVLFYILNFMIMLLESVFLYRLFSCTLDRKGTYRFRFSPLYLSLSYALLRYFLSEFFPIAPFTSSLLKIFGFLLIFLIAFYFYSNNSTEKWIWSIVFLLVLAIPELLVMLFMTTVTGLSTDDMMSNDLHYLLFSILCKAVTFLLIECIRARKHHHMFVSPAYLRELGLITAMNLLILLGSVSLVHNTSWIVHQIQTFVVLFISVTFLVSLLTLLLIMKLSRKSQEEIENKLKLQQIEHESRLNADMTGLVDSLRSLRHDMNNHIGIMKGLLHSGAHEDLSDYLQALYEDVEQANDFLIIENKALSVLINSKIAKARQKAIDFQSLITVKEIRIPEKDMCALLGNMIDNAIEANEWVPDEEKYIQLIIKENDSGCTIACENTFFHTPIEKNGRLLSSKSDKRLHGIGIENIKSITTKHGGTYQITYQDLFNVHIFIPYKTEMIS